MITIRISRDWRVHAQCVTELSLPAPRMWARMRDVERFLCDDPLHREVVFESIPAAQHSFRGASLTMRHRLLGIGVDRIGRILTWREGRGYAISDLSRRGVDRAFPHICAFDLAPRGDSACTLTTSARGKWTATWVPRPLVRCWLWWVLKATESRIAKEALRHTRHRAISPQHLPASLPPASHAAR